MTAPLFYKECQFFPHSKYYPYLCLKFIDINLWYYLSILNYYLYRNIAMIKRFMLFVAAMVVSISASAQFQEGKGYLGASLTGLDLHYNGQDGLNLGVQAKASAWVLVDVIISHRTVSTWVRA